MSEAPKLAIGLMSGTSLDGMDAALVRIDGPTHVTLEAFASRPYSAADRLMLHTALGAGTAAEYATLHVQLAAWAAEAAEVALELAGVPASRLDFIAFPGQTIWHEPPRVTWQLGEPAVLAERFGVPVVSNFRARDVAAGGQGAPLVPMADVLLFGARDRGRVLLNLGGMANFTYVARRADDAGAFACDTGPGMAVIDAVARLVDPSLPYDEDGRLARAGRADEAVVASLLAHPFFAAPPPKSTGREHFGDDYARDLHRRVPGADGVATAVLLTARSVAQAIARLAPAATEVVVSGGGARHPVLREQLTRELAAAGNTAGPVLDFGALFFDGAAKEAVAFALLGYLCLHGQPGNLPRATGAAGPRVLGSITPA